MLVIIDIMILVLLRIVAVAVFFVVVINVIVVRRPCFRWDDTMRTRTDPTSNFCQDLNVLKIQI